MGDNEENVSVLIGNRSAAEQHAPEAFVTFGPKHLMERNGNKTFYVPLIISMTRAVLDQVYPLDEFGLGTVPGRTAAQAGQSVR